MVVVVVVVRKSSRFRTQWVGPCFWISLAPCPDQTPSCLFTKVHAIVYRVQLFRSSFRSFCNWRRNIWILNCRILI